MLYELITENENKYIEDLRCDILDEESSDFRSGHFVDNETWLRYWEVNKAFLSKPFGNKLILHKSIAIASDDDEIRNKLWRLLRDKAFRQLCDPMIMMISEVNPAMVGYGSGTIDFLFCNHMFNTEAVYANQYLGETREIKLPDGSTFKLVHGCKLMKALGRIAKACNLTDKFELFRIEQSQIMNEAKMNSELCISIHPLDYMTASVNENGWRSCMNWHDGEYRRGVVEMMNSPIVIVAYLKSRHETLANGKWNSKKWREFFIVDDHFISGIKGYPYWNKMLEDTVLEWLRELYAPYFAERGISINPTRYEQRLKYINCEGESFVVGNNTYLSVECGPAMYNDFYANNDNVYHFYTTSLVEDADEINIRIDYSGPSECVICGKLDSYEDTFDSEGDLACRDCIEHHYCTHCGEHISRASDIIEINGYEYCPYCVEELDRCVICDEPLDANTSPEDIFFGVYFPTEDNPLPNNENVLMHSERDPWDYNHTKEFIHEFCLCSECLTDICTDHNPWSVIKTFYYDYRWRAMIPWTALNEQGRSLCPAEDVKKVMDRIDANVQTEHYEEAIDF